MKHSGWFLGFSVAFLALACSSGGGSAMGISASDASAFVGIYQATGYTENTTSCDAPGASILDPVQEKFFLIASANELGDNVVVVVPCTDIADCQTKRSAVQAGGFYQAAYSFTLSSAANATTLGGFEATTGFGDGTTCTGRTYADHTLSVNADHSVHLESRTKDLPDQPEQGGFCEVVPTQSKQEAASAPCSDLQVLDGTFVQAM